MTNQALPRPVWRDRRAESPASALQTLDRRSREIFRQIVESYLGTGEPVGSRHISRQLPVTLSPASVRNVMADLESLGLIYAPHTSAGRLPTEDGLRFFVDALLEVGDLVGRGARSRSRRRCKAASPGRTRRDRSSPTRARRCRACRAAPASCSPARSTSASSMSSSSGSSRPAALVVLVGEDGSVENRLIDLDPGTTPSALIEAGNYLNSHIRGRTLAEARAEIEHRQRRSARRARPADRRGWSTPGLASWADAGVGPPETLIVRGRANLLDDVTALEDLERVRLLFDDLETQRELIRLLGLAEAGEGVRIFIGSENKLFSLSGSSLVVSPYRDSEQRVVGVLGVIGPTRLNYARIIPMVDYTAKVVGRLLG